MIVYTLKVKILFILFCTFLTDYSFSQTSNNSFCGDYKLINIIPQTSLNISDVNPTKIFIKSTFDKNNAFISYSWFNVKKNQYTVLIKRQCIENDSVKNLSDVIKKIKISKQDFVKDVILKNDTIFILTKDKIFGFFNNDLFLKAKNNLHSDRIFYHKKFLFLYKYYYNPSDYDKYKPYNDSTLYISKLSISGKIIKTVNYPYYYKELSYVNGENYFCYDENFIYLTHPALFQVSVLNYDLEPVSQYTYNGHWRSLDSAFLKREFSKSSNYLSDFFVKCLRPLYTEGKSSLVRTILSNNKGELITICSDSLNKNGLFPVFNAYEFNVTDTKNKSLSLTKQSSFEDCDLIKKIQSITGGSLKETSFNFLILDNKNYLLSGDYLIQKCYFTYPILKMEKTNTQMVYSYLFLFKK